MARGVRGRGLHTELFVGVLWSPRGHRHFQLRVPGHTDGKHVSPGAPTLPFLVGRQVLGFGEQALTQDSSGVPMGLHCK